jgi:hydrogenase/urease accessory protein HupE
MRHSFFLLLLLIASSFSQAHKLAPSLLQLTELEPGQFEVYWKTPKLTSAGQKLEPVFPAHCTAQSPAVMSGEGTGLVGRWLIQCQQPMAGETLSVRGMASTGTATLVKVQWSGGGKVQGLINARNPSMSIPDQQSSAEIIADYVALGAEHIWLGVDHLLFVLALVMLVTTSRKLVWTITAFTVGHSMTLSLVSLGYLNYPVSLIEFTIALSILVLAIELARPQSGDHWISKNSWLVAVSFGLLHGMGFAGALREVGLPAGDIPLALFSFNIGIELGQLAFIFVCLGLAAAFLRYAQQLIVAGRWVLVYSIGSLSAYWCIERGLSVITGV